MGGGTMLFLAVIVGWLVASIVAALGLGLFFRHAGWNREKHVN